MPTITPVSAPTNMLSGLIFSKDGLTVNIFIHDILQAAIDVTQEILASPNSTVEGNGSVENPITYKTHLDYLYGADSFFTRHLEPEDKTFHRVGERLIHCDHSNLYMTDWGNHQDARTSLANISGDIGKIGAELVKGVLKNIPRNQIQENSQYIKLIITLVLIATITYLLLYLYYPYQVMFRNSIATYGAINTTYEEFDKTIMQTLRPELPLDPNLVFVAWMEKVLHISNQPIELAIPTWMAALVAALFIAEVRRNPVSFLVNLILLELIKNGIVCNYLGEPYTAATMLFDSRQGPVRDLYGKEMEPKLFGGTGPMAKKGSYEEFRILAYRNLERELKVKRNKAAVDDFIENGQLNKETIYLIYIIDENKWYFYANDSYNKPIIHGYVKDIPFLRRLNVEDKLNKRLSLNVLFDSIKSAPLPRPYHLENPANHLGPVRQKEGNILFQWLCHRNCGADLGWTIDENTEHHPQKNYEVYDKDSKIKLPSAAEKLDKKRKKGATLSAEEGKKLDVAEKEREMRQAKKDIIEKAIKPMLRNKILCPSM